jgi:hypothetical protein
MSLIGAVNPVKLYLVRIRGGYSSVSTNYNEIYVIADNPTAAYDMVFDYLDKNDLCFTDDRELKNITLIAEASPYPKCKTMIFIPGIFP